MASSRRTQSKKKPNKRRPSSKMMSRFYTQIDDKKRQNLREGKDECNDLPHQQYIKSRPSKTRKLQQANIRSNATRKAAVIAKCHQTPNAASHVHEALETLSTFLVDWEAAEPKKKSRKAIAARTKSLEKAQEHILKEIDLKWECKVHYSTPDDWELGDSSVCKEENATNTSYVLKINGLDWFEVKPSTIEGAGLGLFACRRFEPGLLLGFFMGKYDADDTASTGYQFKHINPRPEEKKSKKLPYFGLHFSNDPFFDKDMTNMKKRMAKNLEEKVKVEFGAGYNCRSICRIDKGSEIFVLYQASKTKKALETLRNDVKKK